MQIFHQMKQQFPKHIQNKNNWINIWLSGVPTTIRTIDFIISNRLHDLNSSLKSLPPLPLLVDNLWKNSRTRRGIFCFGCFINLWIANFVLTSVNKNYLKLTPWPENTEQLFHKPKLKWKGQPPHCPPSPLRHCLQQLPRPGPSLSWRFRLAHDWSTRMCGTF